MSNKKRYSPHKASQLSQPIYRYRYTRWYLRLIAFGLDWLGNFLMAIVRYRSTARTTWDEPKKVLIVQFDHLGDAVLTTGMFPLLRARYPHARIDLLVAEWNQEPFHNNPYVNTIHISRHNWLNRRISCRMFLGEALRLGLEMQRHQYDLAIDVRGDVLVAFLLWMARIPRRLGWGVGGGSFLYTDCPTWIAQRPEIETRRALLEPLGIQREASVLPQLFPTDRQKRRVTDLLNSEKGTKNTSEGKHELNRLPSKRRARSANEKAVTTIVLHVSAGTEAKRWRISHQRELVRQICRRGDLQVVLVGGRSDCAVGRRISAGFSISHVRDLTGKLAVLELAALMKKAQLFIGGDSGPAHIAGWADIPTVVLFSGTNRMEQWRPPGKKVQVVHEPVTCMPCHQKCCPFSDHPCMERITPEKIYHMANNILGRPVFEKDVVDSEDLAIPRNVRLKQVQPAVTQSARLLR